MKDCHTRQATQHAYIENLSLNDRSNPRIPKSYEEAMTIPEWRKAIETELEKFRTHNCLIMAIYDGQHLVPMKWIFSIKTDGTYKARLVGRGNMAQRITNTTAVLTVMAWDLQILFQPKPCKVQAVQHRRQDG